MTLSCARWLWLELELVSSIAESDNGLYIRWAAFLAVVFVLGGVFWFIMNKPNVVDFMIATEAEMRKVNWPSKRELIGSTWVVICGTLLMAMLLFGVDIAFAWLFQNIGVLQGGG